MTSLTSPNRLPKSRWIGLVLLGVLWLLFSLWQWFEHHHQCQLIRSALSSQAEALSNAVNSSIQSHRWFGPFVQQQLPSTLEVLARADNVIAIAVVVDDDSDHVYTVGDPTAAECSLPDGEFIRGEMLQLVSSLEMPGNPPANRPVRKHIRRPSFMTVLIVLGGLLSALAVGILVVTVLVPAILSAGRSALRSRCRQQLGRIGEALALYHDEYGRYPPAFVADDQGRPRHSWRVLILPQLGYRGLYNRYDFDSNWDSPANLELLSEMGADVENFTTKASVPPLYDWS